MSFPDKEKIGTLKENGNPELLAELDSQGLLIAPGETAAGYADRLLAEEERIGKLREKLAAEKEIDPYTGLTIEAGMEIPGRNSRRSRGDHTQSLRFRREMGPRILSETRARHSLGRLFDFIL